MRNQSILIDSLLADGPATEWAQQLMLYGQFVGSWDGTVVIHNTDGTKRESSAEVHFDWALAGRAIQDVWIAPSRRGRLPSQPDRMYGTTLRAYDPGNDLWHITWIDPVKQAFNRMTGRKAGNDIVQEYRDERGVRCQWMFTEITDSSFHWIARDSSDEGANWIVRGEFLLRRREGI